MALTVELLHNIDQSRIMYIEMEIYEVKLNIIYCKCSVWNV